MTAVTKLRMTADEFIPWAMNQPKRYELVSGEVVAMSSERAGHARAKALVWRSLSDALRERALPCEAFSDGMSVRVDTRNGLRTGRAGALLASRVDDAAVEINDPIIVVEVVSPSSRSVDVGAKLDDYFRLPSVRHYLIVEMKNRTVIHHERKSDGHIETGIVRSGTLVMDPPGIAVEVEGFFAG